MKSKFSEIFMYVLGAVIVIGFFFLLIFLIRYQIPEQNHDIMYLTVGALIGSFTTVVGYFYGSSKGSKDKTDLIASK